ncbi:MAG TPA: CocE/NonD family hydrolase [Mycobacteriales bacterium]|nr:CocE/NonD family hydrolase [Mycobacteriales bacterium]
MRRSTLLGLVTVLCAGLAAPVTAAEQATAAPERRREVRYDSFVKEHVRVPMRDGVELAADIYRPVTPAKVRVPVILQLTPYHSLYKALDPNEDDLPTGEAKRYVPVGYAYVVADVRGTWASGGCWDYGGLKERQDGYDLVEWLGTRAWSNGKVAMTGASYDGTTANAAAVERPPHLATIVPISAISRWWGYAYQQGARSSYSGTSADIDPPSDTPTDFMFAYGFVPPPHPDTVTSAQQIAMRWTLCDRLRQTERGYDLEPDYDAFWVERDYLKLAARVKVPVLISHGLLDFNVKTWEGTAWYEALRTEKAMVLGQWPHASPRGKYPDWDEFLTKWYERWLYGVRNGVEHEPPVRIQSSDREWRMGEWGRAKRFALPLGGEPTTIVDDGTLDEEQMLRGAGAGTRFVRIAVPKTEGGLHLQGRPVLRLAFSSDRPSTQLDAVLCDVGPDGACRIVSRAYLNARYLGGLTAGKDLEPGKVYTAALEFIDKDHVVAEGRHLELIISSSSTTWVFPDELRARNTLLLDKSSLVLPLVR